MTEFLFRDSVAVTFGAHTFELPSDVSFVQDKLGGVNDRLKGKIAACAGDEKAMLNAFLDALDEILGEGATGKIFEGHVLNAQNVIGAYAHVINSCFDPLVSMADTVEAMKARIDSAVGLHTDGQGAGAMTSTADRPRL